MQATCCGCSKKISPNDTKNIFDDNVSIYLRKEIEDIRSNENTKRVKLSHGIELITGQKIVKIYEQSTSLCNICLQKVESYLNFRARLLSSLCTLNSLSELTDATTAVTSKSVESEHRRASQLRDKDVDVVENENSRNSKSVEVKPMAEDIINVDENSMPLYFSASSPSNDEGNTDDSIGSVKLDSEQRNNDPNDSENSNDISKVSAYKEILSKIQENDIESEIDVCSGEDDEVLELDVQCGRNETVEIDSSSESDIEVCDYEPSGKRLKSYNTLPPPILF